MHAAGARAGGRGSLAASASIRARAATACPAIARRGANGRWRVRVGDAVVAFQDRLQGLQRQALSSDVGDFVVKRADGLFAYQLAVVADDAEQGVTDVVRGADLLASTPRQIHLQRALGFPTPTYLHVPIAVHPSGEKLSKQTGAPPLPDDPLPALLAAWRFLDQPALASRGDVRRVLAPGGRRLDALEAAAGAGCSPRRRSPAPAYNPRLSPPAFGLPRSTHPAFRGRLPGAAPPRPRMTTLVAVRKHDEIAIAADSLTTFGDTRLASAVRPQLRQDHPSPRAPTSGCAAPPRTSSCSRACCKQNPDLDFCSRLAIFETFRKLHPILKDAALPQSEGGGGRSVRVDADHGADRQRRTASSACTRCARCSSTRASGRSARAASSRWARCTRSTRASRPPRRSRRSGIEAGATFDKNSALPMTLYTVTAAPA